MRNVLWLYFRMAMEILTFLLLQNYLLGKKETSEMADRNKEVLLEVRLPKRKEHQHLKLNSKTLWLLNLMDGSEYRCGKMEYVTVEINNYFNVTVFHIK